MAALAAVAQSAPVSAAELRGRIELVSARSGRPARGIDLSEAVVAYTPAQGATPVASSEPSEMATLRKRFEPSSLVVASGSSVIFPNFDPILHNVFSLTPGQTFDLGHYGRGEGKSVTFSGAGLVRVFCNVHQSMYAHILVVDTPFYRRADRGGEFAFRDLPDGSGRLLVWHPQADIEILEPTTTGDSLVITLKVKRRRVPRHLNKLGKPYGQGRDRYNR